MHGDSIVTVSPRKMSDCSAIMNNDVETRESQLYPAVYCGFD